MILFVKKSGDRWIFEARIFMIFWSKKQNFMLTEMNMWALGWVFGSTFGYYKVGY